MNRLVSSLPTSTPFVAPEALERQIGRPFKLRMGANESPFGPSPQALEAMQNACRLGNLYNEPEAFELRIAIAAKHNLSADNVLVGAGIDDLLLLICRATIDSGDLAAASLGSYPTFAYALAGVGGGLKTTPYVDDRNNLDALTDLAQDPKVRLVYLANPDNPSGTALENSDVSSFVRNLPDRCMIILDQAYGDFLDPEPAFEIGDERVMSLRTFSKAYGMAGLRIGYAMSGAQTIAALNRMRLHFSVNRVAQAGALASLADSDFLAQVVSNTNAARAHLIKIGKQAGLRPITSKTNFVTLDTGSRERAEALLLAMQHLGVFIRKPGKPPLDSCIRVTVGLPQEQSLFGELLSRALQAT